MGMKEAESGLGDEKGGHMAADSWSILSIPRALDDVQLGALRNSDGSERWGDCERDDFYDDEDDDVDGDDNSESQRDYAACSLDDCGYCGHCPC